MALRKIFGKTLAINKRMIFEVLTYYLSFPSALAQLLNIEKGEEFEWIVEDKNLILLKRVSFQTKKKLQNIN